MVKKGKKASKRKELIIATEIEGAEFKISEIVLAYHGQRLYEAKVLKQQKSGSTFSYFLHYQGWRKKWDEWVMEDRVMKNSDPNRKVMTKLKNDGGQLVVKEKAVKEDVKSPEAKADRKAGQGSRNGKRRKGDEKQKSNAKDVTTPKGGAKKRKIDPTIEPHSDSLAVKEIKLKIPGLLKRYLAQDWDNITLQSKLVPLPRNPTVTQVLQQWLDSKSRKPDQQEVAASVVRGTMQYFHRALSLLLLYRFERPQYEEIMEKRKKKGGTAKGDEDTFLCDIYGAEHLLRLFVKLPEILTHIEILAEELSTLQSRFTDLLKWMTRQKNMFCVDGYESTTPEYQVKVADCAST